VDPEGDGDPDGASGGVLAVLAVGLLSAEGECSRLIPLLSSIVEKHRARERETLSKKKTKKRNVRWFPVGNEWDIYSLVGFMPLQ
jgi:hypothetical protein